MMKYGIAGRHPGGSAITTKRAPEVEHSFENGQDRQASIARSLVAALGRTMALAYSQRQGWTDVMRCIDMARCNPQDT